MTVKDRFDAVISMDADLQDDTDALSEFHEVNLYLRGLVPLVGFKSETVYCERGKRAAGESKYPLRKMLSFAFDGITSLSIRPIELVIRAGILFSVIGLGVLIYSFVQWLLSNTVAGWTSLIASEWLIGGLQMIAIGSIGKYVGKIYLETKQRPRYIIEENTLE